MSIEGRKFVRKNSQCALCALRGNRRVWSDLPPEGAQGTNILVLSEAPGEAEDALGKVLVGPAGSFFNWAIGEAGVRRDRLWLANVICCRPPRNEIDSQAGRDAVASCALGLREELVAAYAAGYRVILAQGQTALDALGFVGKIRTLRGSIFPGSELEKRGLPPFRVLVAEHPSGVMQSGGKWDRRLIYVSDLEKLKTISDPKWKPVAEHFLIEPGVAEVLSWLRAVPDGTVVGADIETDGLDRYWGELVCFSLARSASNVLVIPWRLRGRDDFYFSERERALILAEVERFFSRVKLVFQNAAFDVPYIRLKLCALPVESVGDDTFLLHSVVSPETEHNLGFITSIFGLTPYWKDDFLNRPGSIYDMVPRELWTYNARDSAVLLQCRDKMLEILKALHLESQYYDITMPLFREAVLEMEEEGVGFDATRMQAFKTHMEAIVDDLEERLRAVFALPEAFTFTGQQLLWLFFGKIPPSVPKTLASLAAHEEAIAKIEAELATFRSGLDGTKLSAARREKMIAAREATLARRRGMKNYAEEREVKALAEAVKPPFVIAGYDGVLTKSGDLSMGKDGIISYKGRLERELDEREDRLDTHAKALAEGGLSAKQTAQRESWQTKAEAEIEALGSLLTFVDLLIERAGLVKLVTSFTKYRPAPDGRIHPWWNAGGTSTTRFSCSGPNLEQLPKGDEESSEKAKVEALEVRKSFIARPGYGFASADLTNAEVAMFAYETGDDILIDIYESGKKIHDINAWILFQVKPEDRLYKAAKAAAKIFQFGRYQYGGTLRTVQRQMRLKAPGFHLSKEDLEAADARWWAEHPAVAAWGERVEAEVVANRIIYNAFGMARQFLGPKHAIGREAKSFLIQGGIAHTVNSITLRVQRRKRLEIPEARLVMQYHDQLVYEAPLGPKLDAMCAILAEEFQRPFDYRGHTRQIRAEVEYSKPYEKPGVGLCPANFSELKLWEKPGDAL